MPAMNQPMRVLTSRATVDWYTPPDVIEIARATLGAIDLDPASCDTAQSWIKATEYHTLNVPDLVYDAFGHDPDQLKSLIADISHAQMAAQPPWVGRVWLNPPFDDTQTWVDRMRRDYARGGMTGLLLVNAAPGYAWFEHLWREQPVCMLRERLRFINGTTGVPGGQAKRGQAVFYFGADFERFQACWSSIGKIITP